MSEKLNPYGFREMEVEITSIKLNEKNPRKITRKEAIELNKSLEKFGLIDKPILNADLSCIAGHQRITIRSAKGDKTIICQVPEKQLPPEDADELLLRHNKNTGSWDDDKLKSFFPESLLKNVGFPEDLLKSFSSPEDKVYSDPVYPITPRLSEKYSYVMIITDNAINDVNLRTILGIEDVKDYKSSFVGTGRVITYEQFKEKWDGNN